MVTPPEQLQPPVTPPGYGLLQVPWMWAHPPGTLTLRIDEADPVVAVHGAFLAVAWDMLRRNTNRGEQWPVTFDGAILRITGENRTAVYRICKDSRLPDGWYRGEWAD